VFWCALAVKLQAHLHCSTSSTSCRARASVPSPIDKHSSEHDVSQTPTSIALRVNTTLNNAQIDIAQENDYVVGPIFHTQERCSSILLHVSLLDKLREIGIEGCRMKV
jgi:hypothetical protein